MPFCWKRPVLFFCIFVLGLGGCLDHLAMAGSYQTFIPGILKEYTRLRMVSGYITYNGNGLDNVGIYDGDTLLAVTNSVGYYSTGITQGLPTTLTPRKTGFQFSPPSRVIPEDQYDHPNQNFTAQSTVPLATISGSVICPHREPRQVRTGAPSHKPETGNRVDHEPAMSPPLTRPYPGPPW